MPDDPNDQEQPVSPPDGTSPPANASGTTPAPRSGDTAPPGRNQSGAEGPASGVRRALSKRDAKGRPVAVYAILGSVVAVLALLMVIVYFSDSERTQPDQPICTTIDAARTTRDIREGEVETVTVGFDENAIVATDPTWGPVLARIDYLDGTCAYLPQGLANQEGILAVVGAVTFYNETTDSAQVTLVYNEMADLDPSLFMLPTEDLPVTPVPTEIPATPTEPATATPTVAAASPAASPAGTPVMPPTETPTGTP